MEEQKVSLIDYLLALAKWKKLIIINFLVVCVVAAGIGLLLHKWYRATATIMPPAEEAGRFGLPLTSANLPLDVLGLRGPQEKTLTYLAILQSRTVMASVARKFNLLSINETGNIEGAVQALRGNVSFDVQKEGTIAVSVLDKSPQRAADMANAFVYYLDSLNTELNIQKAKNDRIFIGKRWGDNKRDLKKAEEALRSFQESHGAIAISEQTEAAIKAAADLQAQIIASEVELGIKKRSLSTTHAEVIRIQNQLTELRKKLDDMKFGNTESFKGSRKSTEIFIPFAEVPELSLTYARLLREVEVQSRLYQLLAQQYEQAKIEEAKDTPTVQVLDPAIPPLRKAKPKRAAIVVASAISCTLILILVILIYERVQMIKEIDSERYTKIKSLLSALWIFRKK